MPQFKESAAEDLNFANNPCSARSLLCVSHLEAIARRACAMSSVRLSSRTMTGWTTHKRWIVTAHRRGSTLSPGSVLAKTSPVRPFFLRHGPEQIRQQRVVVGTYIAMQPDTKLPALAHGGARSEGLGMPTKVRPPRPPLHRLLLLLIKLRLMRLRLWLLRMRLWR